MSDKKSSRKSGWHKQSYDERLNETAKFTETNIFEITQALRQGLTLKDAETLVENVIGLYALPFSIATNFKINDKDYLIPMAIEEPSVVAAASNAARLIRDGGGFQATPPEPIMISQIQLFAEDLDKAEKEILNEKNNLLELANSKDKTLIKLLGGAKDLVVRKIKDENGKDAFIVVHLYVDVRDAMGANSVNTMAETLAPELRRITGGNSGLRILSNLADRRLVEVKAKVPLQSLEMKGFSAEKVRDGIISASRFAELDPYRASTHNKGIMNGVDAVVMATGNDWRAIEAGAHSFAAISGTYKPLCIWTKNEDGSLAGQLEMPMAVGLVGGATRVHPGARMAIKILGIEKAEELATIIACTGMANNLAAIRALSTEGIQKGHMRLHNRSRGLIK